MVQIKSDKGNRTFRNTADAAEWLIVARPVEVSVNGVDVSHECEWDAYGVTLGVLDHAEEYGADDDLEDDEYSGGPVWWGPRED